MPAPADAPLALVCPGQGAEEPGMGVALAARSPRAARLLALASEVTGLDVPRALERGGRALGRTDVLQPVLVAVSLGAGYHLLERGVRMRATLGHSLGELTAVALATALPDEVALGLAAARGRLMHEAALASPGGMLALRARTPTALAAALDVALAEGCVLAAENAPDERVVSGPEASVRAAERALGAVSSRLRTVGPWHSPAMQPAADALRPRLREALAGRTLSAALITSARTLDGTDADGLADVLADALVEPVRFVDALGRLEALGVREALVVPPSRTTRSLVRRAASSALTVVEGDDGA